MSDTAHVASGSYERTEVSNRPTRQSAGLIALFAPATARRHRYRRYTTSRQCGDDPAELRRSSRVARRSSSPSMSKRAASSSSRCGLTTGLLSSLDDSVGRERLCDQSGFALPRSMATTHRHRRCSRFHIASIVSAAACSPACGREHHALRQQQPGPLQDGLRDH
jgi:hypothetical protein